MSCVTFPIAVCTRARAHPISVSQKRLDRSPSDLLCGCEPIIYYLITCHGWGVYLHVRPCNYLTQVAHPYLRNYCINCAENSFAVRRAYFHNNLGTFLLPCRMCTCTPIMLILERFGRFWCPLRAVRCSVGGLRVWRFAHLVVYAVDGLGGLWLGLLAVWSVGGLVGWRFGRLGFWRMAVWEVGGFGGWRFGRLAVCDLGGWRFGRLAVWAVGLRTE